MPITRTTHESMRRRLPFLLLIVASLIAHAAGAQTDLSGLTDEQLAEQLHREDYQAEFDRRLEGYSKAERSAMMDLLRDPDTRRRFPADYSNDELLDLVQNVCCSNSYLTALTELEARYKDADPGELDTLAGSLRTAYGATPYPTPDPDSRNDPVAQANDSTYNGLNVAAKTLLPEKLALNLFREVYLDSGQKGSITRFLVVIEGKPFTGAATRAVLDELQARVTALGDRELTARYENDYLHGILGNRIRQCSDNSFEAIKSRNWQDSDLDIYAMGRFKEPEARTLLLEHYGTISKDDRYVGTRRRVLNALIARWDREHDLEFRSLLRDELTDMLRRDYNDNLTRLMDVLQTIEKTGDPYFIPLVERRRADLDLAEIRRTAVLPAEYLEVNIESTLKTFDEALKTLEAERLK